jgi:hypothetical protein
MVCSSWNWLKFSQKNKNNVEEIPSWVSSLAINQVRSTKSKCRALQATNRSLAAPHRSTCATYLGIHLTQEKVTLRVSEMT